MNHRIVQMQKVKTFTSYLLVKSTSKSTSKITSKNLLVESSLHAQMQSTSGNQMQGINVAFLPACLETSQKYQARSYWKPNSGGDGPGSDPAGLLL